MKKYALVLFVIALVLATGCLGGGSEEVGPGADATSPAADADTGTNDDGDDSEGDGDDGDGTGTGAPEPYTDREVAFVVDGEERGELAVEVAETRSEITEGLMGRESLPNGTGMLFVYGSASQKRFWMKDTLVPLDIIFVDSELRVVNVEHASPGFEGEEICSNPDYYCSDGPAQFVVEAERGYANRTGISAGDQLIIR
jgi:uncharacterized membrane protein (UPF0127 family)